MAGEYKELTDFSQIRKGKWYAAEARGERTYLREVNEKQNQGRVTCTACGRKFTRSGLPRHKASAHS